MSEKFAVARAASMAAMLDGEPGPATQGPGAEAKAHTKDLSLAESFQAALSAGLRKSKSAPLESPWPALDTLMRTIERIGRGGA